MDSKDIKIIIGSYLLSILIWLILVLKYRRNAKFSWLFLLKVLVLAGGLSSIFSLISNNLFTILTGISVITKNREQLALYSIFIGFNEELWKMLFTIFVIYKSKEFKKPVHGIVFALTTALGFAMIENLFYLNIYGSKSLIIRGIVTVPSHLAYASVWGYGIARLKSNNDKKENIRILLTCYFFAVIIHTLFDYYLLMNTWLVFLSFILILMAIAFGIDRLKFLEGQITCRKCFRVNSVRSLYCTKCGTEVKAENWLYKICNECGHRNTMVDSYCNHCGKKVEE